MIESAIRGQDEINKSFHFQIDFIDKVKCPNMEPKKPPQQKCKDAQQQNLKPLLQYYVIYGIYALHDVIHSSTFPGGLLCYVNYLVIFQQEKGLPP